MNADDAAAAEERLARAVADQSGLVEQAVAKGETDEDRLTVSGLSFLKGSPG